MVRSPGMLILLFSSLQEQSYGNPMEQMTLCHDSTTCYCHRLPAPSHLDDSYIFVCLLTKHHSWAWRSTGLALPGKRVAYCTQQDSSCVGLQGRGIWPAGISPAGWNRGIQAGRRRHSTSISSQYTDTWETWERAAENHGESSSYTVAQYTPKPLTMLCYKTRATVISSKLHIRFHIIIWNSFARFHTFGFLLFYI